MVNNHNNKEVSDVMKGRNKGLILCYVSSAFLPSSFCMYTTLVAMTGWFQDSPSLAITGVAAGAIVGWPFSALIGYDHDQNKLLLWPIMLRCESGKVSVAAGSFSSAGSRSPSTCWC